MLFNCIISLCMIFLASAIPVTNDHNALSAPAKAEQPGRLETAKAFSNRKPRADRLSRNPIESTFSHLLAQVLNSPDENLHLSPAFKNFFAKMGLANDDPKLLRFTNDAKLISDALSFSYESNNQEMFNELAFSKGVKLAKKSLAKFYNGVLNPEDPAYKCMIAAIEQGQFEFLKFLDGIDFNIFQNLIISETSNLPKFLDIILKNDVIDRHSERYASAYSNIILRKEWEAARIFLNNQLPLHQKSLLKVLNVVLEGAFKKTPSSINAWRLITYIAIKDRKDEKDREFAKEIFVGMKEELTGGVYDLSNSSDMLKVRMIFDSLSLGDIYTTAFIFEEMYKEAFQKGGWDEDTEQMVIGYLGMVQQWKLTDVTILRKVLSAAWKMIIEVEKAISPDTIAEHPLLDPEEFDAYLCSMLEDGV